MIKNSEKKGFCEKVVELNEKMGGAYFFSPPSSASGRRSYEKQNSLQGQFRLKGNIYEISLETDCSCKIVYFRRNIKVNGQKKDIRAIKKAIEILG